MLAALILAHLLGDFVLQTRWLVDRKNTAAGLAIHAGLVGVAMAVTAWDRLAVWWPWLLVVMVTHGLIDWAKVRLAGHVPWPPIVLFLADQAAHGLVIAAVVALAAGGRPWGDAAPAWWIAIAYILATGALSIALPLWLDPAGFAHRPPAARATIIVAAAVALTLAWRGLAVLVPLVGLGLYLGIARRLPPLKPVPTFGVEFWTAMVVAVSLGSTLA